MRKVYIVEKSFSLRFPIIAPSATVDHGLFVSWTDAITGIFYRKKLYDATPVAVSIAESPAFYNGEKIASNFNFEFWNVDGNSSINLATTLKLYTSLTSFPKFSSDHVSLTASTVDPVGSSSIFATFPWAFPITFNSPQTYP